MSQTVESAVHALPAERELLLGQPRGLFTLFFTEMWERFTYYGMRAMLILFMGDATSDGGLGIDDRTASSIYGLYLGCGYLLALLGGYIADRLIGQQRAVLAGGGLIMIGNATLISGRHEVFFLRQRAGLFPGPAHQRVRHRPAETQHQRDRRAALPGRRLAAGRGLLDLLHGNQPGIVSRLPAGASVCRPLRLALGFRVAGRRHAAGPGAVPEDPSLP